MNETFSFHAPAEVFRRRIDPRWRRAGVLVLLVAVTLGAFGRWVVTSERLADERRAAEIASAREVVATGAPPSIVLDDEAAMGAAGATLSVATDVVAATGSLHAATTATLADELPDLVFVDGPSTAPMIVSVEATSVEWAAAVMAPQGTCYWVRTTSSGEVRYGTAVGSSACTGTAAMAADDIAW